jgi:hypothetical protein
MFYFSKSLNHIFLVLSNVSVDCYSSVKAVAALTIMTFLSLVSAPIVYTLEST